MSIQLILIVGVLVAQLSAEISLPHSLRHLSLPVCRNNDGWNKNEEQCQCINPGSYPSDLTCNSSAYCLVPFDDPGAGVSSPASCRSQATCDLWDCPATCPDTTGKELVTYSCTCVKSFPTRSTATPDVCINGQYCDFNPDNSNVCQEQASPTSPSSPSPTSPSPSPKPSTPFCEYTNGGQNNPEQCHCCDPNGICWDEPCPKNSFCLYNQQSGEGKCSAKPMCGEFGCEWCESTTGQEAVDYLCWCGDGGAGSKSKPELCIKGQFCDVNANPGFNCWDYDPNNLAGCPDRTGEEVIDDACHCGDGRVFCTAGQYCETDTPGSSSPGRCLDQEGGPTSPSSAAGSDPEFDRNFFLWLLGLVLGPALLFGCYLFCAMMFCRNILDRNLRQEPGNPYCCPLLTCQLKSHRLDNEWANERAMQEFGYQANHTVFAKLLKLGARNISQNISRATIARIYYCGSQQRYSEEARMPLNGDRNENVMLVIYFDKFSLTENIRLDRIQHFLTLTYDEEQREANEAADRRAEAENARRRRERREAANARRRREQEEQRRRDNEAAEAAERRRREQEEQRRQENEAADRRAEAEIARVRQQQEQLREEWERNAAAAESAERALSLQQNDERAGVALRNARRRRERREAANGVALRQGSGHTPPPWDLQPGKKFHFFMCHHQTSGGDAVHALSTELESRGYKIWRDNDQHMEQRDTAGMRRGVRESCCLLLFHSGQKETVGANGEAYPDAANSACQHHLDAADRQQCNCNYQSPFTRWFCHVEMLTARQHQLPVVVVQEIDDRSGRRGLRFLERSRLPAVSQGWDFRAFSNDTTENIKEQNLAHTGIVAIPYRRQAHELRKAMLPEIVHQARDKLGLRPLGER